MHKINKAFERYFQSNRNKTTVAAITQHIPDKFSQLVRYYGFYSTHSSGDYAPMAFDIVLI